jgi:hypothetical protein
LAETFRGALALGSTAFVDRLRRGIKGNRHEQPALRAWQRLLPFEQVVEVEVVAQEKGEHWAQFRDRHGDWGHDVALWLGRHHCGLTQVELGTAAGGMAYPAAGQAVRRIDPKRRTDRKLARLIDRLERQLVLVAT